MKTMFLLAGAAALLAAPALATDAEDIRLLKETRVTLSQAIAAAEKSQGGRAIEAGLDDEHFTPTYEVSVVRPDDRVFDVQVDGVSGKIVAAREDRD